MTIDIRKDGALIEGFKPEYYWCGGGCCTGDTPTPPVPPGPDTGDTGITAIRIIVADNITDSGKASAVFTPSTADTSLYYTSSDPDTATIHPYTGEITVYQDGVVIFCVEDLYTGLEDCKEVTVHKSIEPGPDTGDTGITSIQIILADTITDEGIATSIYRPVTADTVLVYTSSDNSTATIDQDTGEIEVEKTGFVTFCVEDLLSGLKDCKTVYVIKSEPGPGPEPPTGTTETRLKVIYYRRAGSSAAKLLTNTSGITSAEFEDGTIITNPENNFTHMFESEGLQTVYYELADDKLNSHLFEGVWGIERVEVPSGVTRIDNYCFYHTSGGGMAIILPDTLVEIGDYAFEGSSGEFVGGLVIPEGVKTIGHHCFELARYITSLTIPSTVESIGDAVCQQCSRLESVNILCNISAYTGNGNPLSYCPSLSSFNGPSASLDHRMLITDDGVAISFAGAGLTGYTTPSGIERIGSWCFATDEYVDLFPTQIEEITVSEGVKYIEGAAFSCHNLSLRRVNLPSTLLRMDGREVFDGRSNLADIYCYASTAPVIGTHTFYHKNVDYFPYNGKLHYPVGSDYSSWFSSSPYYLGYYGWTGQEINDI